MTEPNHEVERRIKLLQDELTDCKIRANDRLERLEKAEGRAAELQKQLADERCHRHGAFNPEGDCPFCDKEQAEAERDKAKAQALAEGEGGNDRRLWLGRLIYRWERWREDA